jgi:hypothetical protein
MTPAAARHSLGMALRITRREVRDHRRRDWPGAIGYSACSCSERGGA